MATQSELKAIRSYAESLQGDERKVFIEKASKLDESKLSVLAGRLPTTQEKPKAQPKFGSVEEGMAELARAKQEQARTSAIAGGLQIAQDVAAVPYHFVNQLGFNAPRAISNMAMAGAGDAMAEEGGVPARVAGVTGAVMSPLNKFMLFKQAGLIPKALAGAAQGALYSPNENLLDIKQRAIQAGVGGVLGPASELVAAPMSRFLSTNAEKAGRATAQATKMYREMLRPSQGEIKKVELKLGKDVNQYYKLAAKEGLPIKTMEDNKLDVSDALSILKQKAGELDNQLQKQLQSGAVRGGQKITPKYDLNELAKEAKKKIAKDYDNALELKQAESHIDDIIKAEKERYGDVVDASTLNQVKRGLWGRSYGLLEPNTADADRALGFILKERIEKDFPAISKINQKSSDYLNLATLLRGSHGRVIAKGRIGQHAIGLAGGAVGGAVGHAIMPGLGSAGGFYAGQQLATKAMNEMVKPERVSSRASELAQKYGGPERKFIKFLREKTQ